MSKPNYDGRKTLIKWYEYQMVTPENAEPEVSASDDGAMFDASEEEALKEAMNSFSEEMLAADEVSPEEETEEDRINRIMGVFRTAKQDNVDILFRDQNN